MVGTRPMPDLGAATHGAVMIILSFFSCWFASMSNLGGELTTQSCVSITPS